MHQLDQPISLAEQWRDKPWFLTVVGVLLAMLAGWVIGAWGILGALATIGIPVALAVGISVLLEPRIGLYIYLHLSFLIGFTRFLPPNLSPGTALDAVLVLTLLSTFLNGKRMNWKRLREPIFWLIIVWFSFNILEYFNPEHPHPAAWFYHARSFSISWFIVAIIVLVNPITKSNILLFCVTWIVWSFLGALWGFKQQYIGLESAELRWLAEGADRQHILWGQLRSFSFYSDAGQFGSEMAGVTLLCIIFFFETKSWLLKAILAFVAVILFWGFALSGTRGALFVIIGGYPAYLFLKRNPVHILRGVAIAIPVLAILMFTHIGDSNYQIYRIRTALRPTQDASFQVRLDNQQKLRNYLKDKPFGAGIGTSSGAGQRFSPNHFASQIPTDSWYVQIWIETGIVGLTLYLIYLASIILLGTYKIWQLNDPWTISIMLALLAEFIGICVVSYTNPILGQYPTSTLLFITSVLFSTCERWDTQKQTA
ncbi:O-antigen ligase family protein [Spirosoma sp. BT702]|uniref:O-antigen ligase family protein n=1 Tax=Spirosoma profusum TaxID=2771354 RepID=A0A926Y0G1_9BACT|nr:O-antigen ligase family protein [Spirosoma profusum]MBD2704318.1 O-antigen ligase family protein [Spirosoma profusum]